MHCIHLSIKEKARQTDKSKKRKCKHFYFNVDTSNSTREAAKRKYNKIEIQVSFSLLKVFHFYPCYCRIKNWQNPLN
ncbi:hypothetical protein T07_9785 [Trichinella nelsoni]|uniref:Uncharacterized protein n=1 Tax=Trichinella nelsoni TaxID=6336 RepID=A0A0V0S0V5_9BILA|nr:hypothetical protein T07_9785 [Trichinella nelsoni]